MNKNILTADNSFILKEDKAINIKIIGKQGKISNLAINKNKYDNYIPTSSDVSDKFSSIIFDLKNLRTISWRGIIQSVPLNDKYAIIQDDIASYDLLNKYMGLNKLELNKEYFYEYNVLSNRLSVKQNAKGETIFICQDSDDDIAEPIEMPESFLLPSIHHAGLPEKIAMKDFQYEDSWKVGMKEFEEFKQGQYRQSA